jgi:hypothetical protein
MWTLSRIRDHDVEVGVLVKNLLYASIITTFLWKMPGLLLYIVLFVLIAQVIGAGEELGRVG